MKPAHVKYLLEATLDSQYSIVSILLFVQSTGILIQYQRYVGCRYQRIFGFVLSVFSVCATCSHEDYSIYEAQDVHRGSCRYVDGTQP